MRCNPSDVPSSKRHDKYWHTVAGKYSSAWPTTNVRRRGILRRNASGRSVHSRESTIYERVWDVTRSNERKREEEEEEEEEEEDWQSLDATLVALSAWNGSSASKRWSARADPRSPIPLARSARPRLGTVGQVGRSRNAQTADSRALRLRNPCREKVSPPVPVPASFQRSSHRHHSARDPQLRTCHPLFTNKSSHLSEAAGPCPHVDAVDRPVTTASSGSPAIDPSRPGLRR